MKGKILETIKIVAFGVFLSFGISYVYAWTAPTGSFPTNNAPQPVNVGSSNQVKTGSLGVGPLAVYGDSILNYQNTSTSQSNSVTVSGNIYVSGKTWIGNYTTLPTINERMEVTGNVRIDGLQHGNTLPRHLCAKPDGTFMILPSGGLTCTP
jgi:hypothetical protein